MRFPGPFDPKTCRRNTIPTLSISSPTLAAICCPLLEVISTSRTPAGRERMESLPVLVYTAQGDLATLTLSCPVALLSLVLREHPQDQQRVSTLESVSTVEGNVSMAFDQPR